MFTLNYNFTLTPVFQPAPSPWGNLIFGTSSNDTIHGSSQTNDTVWAGAGDDVVYGWGGNNLLRGEAGNDVLIGGRDNDRLIGGADNDKLLGGGGNDRLEGGTGNDILDGGRGDDILTGGADADTFRFAPEYMDGHDTITDFEDGIDTISFAAYEPPYAITIDDLSYVEDASGVTISYGNGSVFVAGATWAEVQDDLVFV